MATRQTRRQLQFSGFEMAMIAVSFVVTVTAVFFLGLFVGKKNASSHASAGDRVARIPVDDFTKYKRPAPIVPAPKEMRAAAADPTAAAGAPSAVPARTAASGVAVAGDAGKSAAGSAPAASGSSPAQASAAGGAKPATAATAPADAAAKEALAKAKREAAAKEAAAKEKAEPAAGRGYTVQILATRKQADADALVSKLKSRGYAAYIKRVTDGAGAWYRVRVGSYGAFSEARVMADKCRHDLGLGQAFVSTE